jgi:hypothetical protein
MRLPLITFICSAIVLAHSKEQGKTHIREVWFTRQPFLHQGDLDLESNEVYYSPNTVSRRFFGGMIGNFLDDTAMHSAISFIKTGMPLTSSSMNPNERINSVDATRCSMEAWGKIFCFLATVTKRVLAIDQEKSQKTAKCDVELWGRIVYVSMTITKRLLAIDDP